MIDFTEIPYDRDDWELFSRDFLQAIGLHIETPPDRGSDHGRDLLVTETISGEIANMRLRWLVSCKHFAHSRRSVTENDEQNLLERVRGFKADGFIGVYSTLASSGLNHRLEQLRASQDIKDYKIFDYREVENRLVTAGYSSLLMRYFPESYKRIKPIHLLSSEYIPLRCAYCDKDLLQELFTEHLSGNLILISSFDGSQKKTTKVFCACKGRCDEILSNRYAGKDSITGWLEISVLVIPTEFLTKLFAFMNQIREGGYHTYTDEAYGEMKYIFIVIAQKVLRAMTEEEWQRVGQLRSFEL
ncbi:restriction endonuclease [Microcoleus sp. FACHB-SPT15]|uniref:restriction endonuclease n=1 Tax=Microcoleus sp. FACHB-SPT15 TaxID=2692830 RepID=UPI001785863B|nr:restriction endonuclease [Microcoleus sp. FACHB-SPT15]MBD1808022.1 restriction endonuclease [Microcoleus sp. FACHB-SPT15]